MITRTGECGDVTGRINLISAASGLRQVICRRPLAADSSLKMINEWKNKSKRFNH